MSDDALRVARSRIVAVRRAAPYRFSVGDEALVELRPGLLRFLSLRDTVGRTLGEGSAPEWVVGVGAAGTAAYAVVEPDIQASLNCWTGVTNEIAWRRAALPDETLHAFCRLSRLRRTSAHLPYRVFSRERGDLLVEGEFVFVNVTPSGPRPFVADFFGTPAPTPPAAAAAASAETPPSAAPPPPGFVAPPRIRSLDGRTAVHPLRLEQLGPFESPREVALPAPGAGEQMRVFRRGQEVATTAPAPGVLCFTAEAAEGYELHVVSEPVSERQEATSPAWWTAAPQQWEEAPEEEVDLVRLERPRIVRQLAGGAPAVGASWEWVFPVDLFRLLVNPVAGNTAPLGRRLHPYGRIAEGMAVHAALAHAGQGWAPRSAHVHWILPIEGRQDFRLVATAMEADGATLAFAATLYEGARHVTSVDVTLARS